MISHEILTRVRRRGPARFTRASGKDYSEPAGILGLRRTVRIQVATNNCKGRAVAPNVPG